MAVVTDDAHALLLRIRERIAPGPTHAPAAAEVVSAAEAELGFELHPLHRALLLEIGNGGLGPGADGLFGVRELENPERLDLAAS